MKKLLSVLLALCGAFAFAACGDTGSSGSYDPQKPYGSYELTEFADGSETYYLSGVSYTLTTSTNADGTFLGSATSGVTIEGAADTLTRISIKGTEAGEIRPYEGQQIVFKNLTLRGGTTTQSSETPTHRVGYFGVGGNVRFENCIIEGSLQIRDGAEVAFVGCTFRSMGAEKYSVWVSDGSVSFRECEFYGYRALKLHEQPQYGYDVLGVSLTQCIFNDISQKPGIAIGDIVTNPEETVLSVAYCSFIGCAPWDQDGSMMGIDGFYEADVNVRNFIFEVMESDVDGEVLNSAIPTGNPYLP